MLSQREPDGVGLGEGGRGERGEVFLLFTNPSHKLVFVRASNEVVYWEFTASWIKTSNYGRQMAKIVSTDLRTWRFFIWPLSFEIWWQAYTTVQYYSTIAYSYVPIYLSTQHKVLKVTFSQSWALSVFLNFFSIKNSFLHFFQVNLTGSGLFK